MSTYKILYNGQAYECRDNESLIDSALRQGIELKFSCRKGSCQVCMIHCETGVLPAQSQIGLRSQYIEKNYFLPCCCKPIDNMKVSSIPVNALYSSAMIYKKEQLSENVCRLLIEPSQVINYQPGQYINLQRPSDGLSRSYSLVSHKDDHFIELHIQKMPDGKMSNWIYNELAPGCEVLLQGPIGKCTYQQVTDPKSSIILAGSNTGIAPLVGILNEALRHQHSGNIYILHSGKNETDIYLHQTLLSLKEQHENLHYFAFAETTQTETISKENLTDVLEKTLNQEKNATVYLAGSQIFVETGYDLSQKLNIPDKQIYSDSFDYKDLRKNARRAQSDSEMWSALDQGKRLKIILDDFYRQVYKDSRLSPFFENSTERRSSEKQYLFMRQLFSGEKVYFGDRPKNSHHWMVIDDELFDYREQLMENCLRKHGLSEHLIQRWIKLDETFRQDIVKDTPQPKIINGVELPLDGYDVLKIDEGTVCDGCYQAIEKNETVRYHLRLGLTYCDHCMKPEKSTDQPAQET